MGYGDMQALETIREANSLQMFEIREQSAVRIGVLVSDHRTMVYFPVPHSVEAGPTTD